MAGRISPGDARSIRVEAAWGHDLGAIARRYGVHRSVIENLVAGRTFTPAACFPRIVSAGAGCATAAVRREGE